MASEIRLIPLSEIIVGPEPQPVRPFQIGPPARGLEEPFPAVLLTRDRRLIAGRACLGAFKEAGYPAIPCRIVDAGDFDLLLTRIHNQILFGDLPAAELDLQLDLYAELCWYRQTRGAAGERRSSDSPQSPHTDESDTAAEGQNLNSDHAAAAHAREARPGPPAAADHPAPSGGFRVSDWHWVPRFWSS